MIVSDKFKTVPVENDTRVLHQKIITIGDYEVMHQKWGWEGIKAESIIFTNEDVADLTEAEIKELVKDSLQVEGDESKMTFSRSSKGFTFVNFNFRT